MSGIGNKIKKGFVFAGQGVKKGSLATACGVQKGALFTAHNVKKAAIAAQEGLITAVNAVDTYTSPRPETAGNYASKGVASYAPAIFQASTEGYYFLGLPGIISGAVACATSLLAEKRTGSMPAGLATGAVIGAGLMAAGALAMSAPVGIVAAAIAGGLLGIQQFFRGNPHSKIRDAAGNAILVSGPFMPGPYKLTGGIASGLAMRLGNSNITKAIIGGITGAAIALAACVSGLIGGIWIPVAVSAVSGALSPFLGPRFSQFFRNLSEDAGKLIGPLSKKVLGKKFSERVNSAIGSTPISFVKEGIKGFISTDKSLTGLIVGGISESIQQAYLFLMSQREDDKLPQRKEEKNKITNTHEMVLSETQPAT